MAKYVSDWHTPTLVQEALARFIDEGGYARHIRRASAAYRARHERIATTLSRDFANHLELLPSSTGLHLTALAPRFTSEQILAVHARAADRGVVFQPLSMFAVGDRPFVGVVLGYGAIATDDIEEALRLLRSCFPAQASRRRA